MSFWKKLFGIKTEQATLKLLWYRNKAHAEKVVAHDPTGLYPELTMTLAHMNNFEGLSMDITVAVMDAVKHGRYKIVAGTNPEGAEGFDLLFYLQR
jgi:hypothetical protein